jgi:hypothetical protein
MNHKMTIKGRTFAANSESQGVFEMDHGAYMQHRGNGQTPTFETPERFRRYVLRMIRETEFRSDAARALRAIPSERRAQASRDNGLKGGKPKHLRGGRPKFPYICSKCGCPVSAPNIRHGKTPEMTCDGKIILRGGRPKKS